MHLQRCTLSAISAAIALTLLAACSTGGDGGGAVPKVGSSATVTVPSPKAPKRTDGLPMASNGITGTAEFGASAGINTPFAMTIVLQNSSASTQNGVNLTDAFPSAAVEGPLQINSITSNTCGGTIGGSTGQTAVTLAGGSIAAGGSCSIALSVSAPAAGTYLIGSATTASTASGWKDSTGEITFSQSPLTTAQFVWNPAAVTIAGPATKWLFVAMPASNVNAGEIAVYQNGTGIISPTCYLTSSSFPSPALVTTNPLNGDLYIYDASQTLSVLNQSNPCGDYSGGAVVPNVQPLMTYPVATAIKGMAVDALGRLVIAYGSSVTFTNPRAFAGSFPIYSSSYGDTWTQVAADLSGVYLYDSTNLTITDFTDSAPQYDTTTPASVLDPAQFSAKACRYSANDLIDQYPYNWTGDQNTGIYFMTAFPSGGKQQPSGASLSPTPWLANAFPTLQDATLNTSSGLWKGFLGSYGAVEGLYTCDSTTPWYEIVQGPGNTTGVQFTSAGGMNAAVDTVYGVSSDYINNDFAISTWPNSNWYPTYTGAKAPSNLDSPVIDTFAYANMMQPPTSPGSVPIVAQFNGLPYGFKPSSFAFGW